MNNKNANKNENEGRKASPLFSVLRHNAAQAAAVDIHGTCSCVDRARGVPLHHCTIAPSVKSLPGPLSRGSGPVRGMILQQVPRLDMCGGNVLLSLGFLGPLGQKEMCTIHTVGADLSAENGSHNLVQLVPSDHQTET